MSSNPAVAVALLCVTLVATNGCTDPRIAARQPGPPGAEALTGTAPRESSTPAPSLML